MDIDMGDKSPVFVAINIEFIQYIASSTMTEQNPLVSFSFLHNMQECDKLSRANWQTQRHGPTQSHHKKPCYVHSNDKTWVYQNHLDKTWTESLSLDRNWNLAWERLKLHTSMLLYM